MLPLLIVVPLLALPFLTSGEAPSARATATPAGSTAPSATVSATAGGGALSSPSPSSSPTPSATPTSSPRSTAAPKATPKPTAKPRKPQVPPPVGVAGYGARTRGGTGGRVIVVSNLNDSGPGSLRAAIDASGPRVITFGVGGVISLKNELHVKSPFATIDASTAPAPVVIRGGMLKITTHDVIVRNLRLRPGDQVATPADADALTLNGLSGDEVSNIVLDHLTMIWGPDIGGMSILGNVHDVTVQYSIMGEGLYLSRHPEAVASQDGHSMGTSIFQLDPGNPWPKRITFHHNLFTTSDQRMPVVQGAECVDLVNNVIYNWGNKGLHGNPRAMNAVGNWFRSGPETTRKLVYEWQHHSANPNPYSQSVYLSGNVADGFTYAVDAPSGVLRKSLACGGLSVRATAAKPAYDTVLAAAGATRPSRDAVDRRIIGNVTSRKGVFFNGVGEPAPNPYWP